MFKLFWAFFRIGTAATVRPAAAVEAVGDWADGQPKRLSAREFARARDRVAVLPGPPALNLCAWAAYRAAGIRGALLAPLGLAAPGVLVVIALSAAYFRWGTATRWDGVFLGLTPVLIAVLLTGAWQSVRAGFRHWLDYALAGAGLAAVLVPSPLWAVAALLPLAAMAGALLFPSVEHSDPPATASRRQPRRRPAGTRQVLPLGPAVTTGIALKPALVFALLGLLSLGAETGFLPVGHLLLVRTAGWFSPQEFADGLALAAASPGGLMAGSAFFGYKLGGVPGALGAALAFYAPPALLALLSLRRLGTGTWPAPLRNAGRGARAALTGMYLAVLWILAGLAKAHWLSVVLFALALVLHARFALAPVWLLLAAALAGGLVY